MATSNDLVFKIIRPQVIKANTASAKTTKRSFETDFRTPSLTITIDKFLTICVIFNTVFRFALPLTLKKFAMIILI